MQSWKWKGGASCLIRDLGGQSALYYLCWGRSCNQFVPQNAVSGKRTIMVYDLFRGLVITS